MNDNSGNILVVDDDVDVLTAARILLKKHYNHVQVEQNPDAIPAILKEMDFDVILLDMNYQDEVSSGLEGFSWLANILKIKPFTHLNDPDNERLQDKKPLSQKLIARNSRFHGFCTAIWCVITDVYGTVLF